MYIVVTKKERDRRRRLEDVLTSKPPATKTITLPSLPKGTSLASITVTLNDGIKWKVCL